MRSSAEPEGANRSPVTGPVPESRPESRSSATPEGLRQRRVPYWIPRASLGLWLVLVAATLETIVLSWAQWENYLSFITSQGNLGNYNQAFYTAITGQGLFYYTTNLPSGSAGTLLAVHFSPTFFALAPLYALDPSPITLIVLKQAALAFAAVPLCGLAKVYFRKDLVPVLFGLLYLVSPLTTNLDWNNVDPEDFLAISLLFALYFLARGRFWPFVVCWIVALGTIEAAPALLLLFAVGALIGTYLVRIGETYWSPAQQRRPLLVAALISAAWLFLAFEVLYGAGPRGGAFGAAYARRYSVLGASSLPDVLLQTIGHPSLAVLALQYQGSLKVLLLEVLLLAGGVFWIAGGLRYLLPVGGYLAFALLSNAAVQYTFGTEYLALIGAFILAGLVEGCAWAYDRATRSPAGGRRLRLAEDLRTATDALTKALDLASVPDSTRVELRSELSEAGTAIDADNLPRAEEKLNLVANALRLPPRSWASVPSVADPEVVDRATPATSSGSIRQGAAYPGTRRGRAVLAMIISIAAVAILAVASASNPFLSTPLAGNPGKASGVDSPTAADLALYSVLARIPPASSVLTTGHLFPEVSDRRNAFTVPTDRYLPTGETLADDYDNWAQQSDFVAVDYAVDPTASEILVAETNLSTFGVYASEAGAVLLERGWHAAPPMWSPYSSKLSGASLKPVAASASERFATALGESLYHPAGGQVGGRLWTGPGIVELPLGNYTATFSLELAAPSPGNQLELSVATIPAKVTDTPLYTEAGETYYAASIAQSTLPAVQLATSTISTAGASGLASRVVSMSFDLNQTGYIEFPGYELSTTMSVYLVTVSLVENAGLP
jgi:uncharacterized membrane protein